MEGTTEDYDLYDTLNLSRDASTDEVRAAFRDLSRTYHPDKQAAMSGGIGLLGQVPAGVASSGSSGAGAEAAFLRVHQAYRVLGDDTMRAFYDKYGLAGVKLAEGLSDDEDEDAGDLAGVNGGGGALALKEDRLEHLEGRVRTLMRKREELTTQRRLAMSGTFTLGAAMAPGHHGAHFRRRYRLQYSATSQTVQIAVTEGLKVTVGCSSHIQGSSGSGAAKLMLAAIMQLSALTAARGSVSIAGNAPEFDFSLTRTISDHLVVQQRLQTSGDGKVLSLSAFPWLSKTMRGNISVAYGDAGSCSIGVVKRSSTSGHKCGVSLNLQPGGGEISAQAKYKASRDFSVKLLPSISQQGWMLQVICAKMLDAERLTKLHWVLRLRRRSVMVRLTLMRSGLRFSIPLELWPEAAGPLPAQEMAFLLALYAAPPLLLRLLFASGKTFMRLVQGRKAATNTPSAEDAAAKAQAEAAAERDAVAAAAVRAAEQRQLIEREAQRRRSTEVAQHGLEIVRSLYGPASAFAGGRAPAADAVLPAGVQDVTDCLMAKVRRSRLSISGTSKASLLGFHDPGADDGRGGRMPDPNQGLTLFVSYRFGGVEHSRIFDDLEPVLLP